MFPFEKLFKLPNGRQAITSIAPVLILFGFFLMLPKGAQAKTCVFDTKVIASNNPFSSCNIAPTDTIIIRDTLDIDVNYEPLMGGVPFDGILIVDGGVLLWSSNVALKLGTNARILLFNGGHLYPGHPSDIGCSSLKTIYFDVFKLASCSGINALHTFSDVNLAGCFDGTGICCDAPLIIKENSGNANDLTLCAPGDTVEISVIGSGSINYSYMWTPNLGNSTGPFKVAQQSNTTYSVSVTAIFDPFGAPPPYLLTCGSSATVKINSDIKLVTSSTPVPCASSAVGKINLTVVGGTAPYKYLWSNGAVTEDLMNLVGGTYTVTVTDSKGCTEVASEIVKTQDNTPPTLTCPGGGSGVAVLNQCTTTIPNIDAVFSDNCPSAQLSYQITGATVANGLGQLSNAFPFHVGSNNVKYLVDDGANIVSCSFTITVLDNQFPTASNPAPITGIQCFSGIPAPDPSVVTTEADNCGTPTVTYLSQSVVSGLSCPGNPLIVSRKYRVTDASGNGINVTQLIEVADDTPPFFTQFPANTTVNCQSVPTPGAVVASDNCDEDVLITYLGETRTNGACQNAYTLKRTWKAEDNCGNSTSSFQTIVVQDISNPVFATVPADVTVNCQSIPAVGNPTANDNCDASVSITYLGETRNDGACPDTYILKRSWKAEDNCGNTATAEQVIQVRDVTSPTFSTVPANITVNCESIPAVGTPSATDNCDAAVAITYLGETRTNGACPDTYSLRRVWQAADNCGNTSTASQVISVRDVTKPQFTSVPADITASCESVPTVGNAIATDNCDSDVTITYNGETRTNGACTNTYTLVRKWTATDNCGNTQTAQQTIQIQDLTKPVFDFVPADATVSCESLPAVGTPTATDNCSPTVSIVYNGETRENGSCLNSYLLRRRWTASDQCGNSASAEQVITVQDITVPAFTQVPADVTVSCNAIPAVGTATATDNCDASVNITYNGETRVDGTCPNTYSLRREWTAEDNCGNTAKATQVIAVRDLTAPVFTFVPAATMASCEALPSVGTPTATDNCAANVTITYLGESTPGNNGACPGNYAMVRTWSAEDACGNTATATQVITVQDITAPVLTSVPADVTVSCANLPAVGLPTATDNCDANLDIQYDGATRLPGACPNSYTLNRKWTVRDDCGNSATAVQTLTVEDLNPPVFTTVPPAITVSCEAIPSVGTPVAVDDCAAGVFLIYNGATRIDGACPDSYTLQRSWLAIDSCGNTATASQMITVQDITAPVFISVPLAQTVSCDAIPAVGNALATDNCDASVSVVYAGQTRVDGDCPNRYFLHREWMASDNCGNTAKATQILTVQDITSPVFTSVPAAITASCDAVPVVGTPVAADNCSANVAISYLGETRSNGSCPGNYTLLRSWSAQDECGNTATATQLLTIQDISKPIVTAVPANITVSCSDIPAVGTPSAVDNCDADLSITYSGATRTNGSCPNTYTLTRKWVIADDCGNTSSATQTIMVQDIAPPIFIAVPAAITVSCESIPPVGTPNAVDNCSSAVQITYTGVQRTDGACPDSYTLRRTWMAQDSCGNTSTAAQLITVQDIAPPIFTMIPANVTVSCDAIPAVMSPTATDNCDGFVNIEFLGQSRVDGSCTYSYQLRREWMATDNCGNTAKATQVVAVQDITSPAFTFVPAATTVSCEAIPAVGAPTAVDNCDPSVTINYLGETRTDGNCPSNYTLARRWSAEDDCGNTTAAVQIITVQDITKPVFAYVPADSTVNCDAIPLPGLPTATDNCSSNPAIVFDGEVIMNSSSPDSYSFQRKWTVTDQCGNASTAIQVLTVQDTIAPGIICPANIQKYADAATCSAIATFPAPPISDNCSAALNLVSSASSGQAFPVGTTTVFMTVNDPSGNATICNFKIMVVDTTAPVLHNCPQNLTFTTSGTSCNAAVNWDEPFVTDPCDQYLIVPTKTIASGSVLGTGLFTNTYTAVDTTGNMVQCSFTITINETVPPVLTNCPQDMVLYTDTCNAVAHWAPPTATDNCGLDALNVNIPSGSLFQETNTTVEYTAVDNWGNTSTCSFKVTVVDVVNPQFSGCPGNMVVNAGVCSIPVNWTQPTATDNCVADPVVFSIPAPGSVFPSGFTTVRIFAQDQSANMDTCTFVVEVIGPPIGLANLPVDQSFVGCDAVATWTPPVPTGVCGPIMMSSNYEPGHTFGIGVTEVIYTLTDTLNHSVIESFTVTVTESVPPTFTCPVSPIKVNISAAILSDPSDFIASAEALNTCDGVKLKYADPVAADNCSVPQVSLESGLATASVFDLGVHDLMFKAKDDAGNTAMCAVQIEVLPLLPLNPQVSDAIGCKDDEITLSATVVPGAAYFWDGPKAPYADNNNLQIFNLEDSETGIYTVYAIVNGCKTPLDSALVRIGKLPFAADDLDYQIGTGELLQNFNVLLNDTYESDDYTLEVISTPALEGLTNHGEGIFSYQAGNKNGSYPFVYKLCSKACPNLCDEGAVSIQVRERLCSYIPNIITPNGDDFNDYLLIPCLDIEPYPNNSLVVYNQWGDKVYEASPYDNDPEKAWYGTLYGKEGKGLPDGTYFYIFTPKPGDAGLKGFIEIFR